MLNNSNRIISYADAIREATDQSMQQNKSVIIIGEGVPDPKAIFNTTKDLLEKYGSDRVFDMPLSENGLTGICIGAALNGIRPIIVHQRIDFLLLAMDQIVNNAAKWHYMFNGKSHVPIVIRCIIGRGWGQGPQHSQALHGLFAQIPGLKVVMPTTAYDAKGMLVAAIEDNNPVIFIEHRWLHSIVHYVPQNIYREPLDKAKIVRIGSDITIVAASFSVVDAIQAAELCLHYLNLNVEVVDLRSIQPLDIETIVLSVNKTRRVIIIDPAFRGSGYSGELCAQITENCFHNLIAPPARISLPEHPVPTSHFMTRDYYPGPLEIVDKISEIIGLDELCNELRELKDSYMKDNEIAPHDVPNTSFKGPF